MSDLGFQTTQNVEIVDKLAGVPERMLATLIDLIIFAGWYYLSTFLTQYELGDVTFYLLVLLPIALYHLLCETFMNGSSVGKLALGIKVVGIDGLKASFSSLLIRWAFRLIDITFTLGGAALLSIGFSKNSQRLGDMAAGTVVIKFNKKVSLKETLFRTVEEDYLPVFKEASMLNADDIYTIVDVFKYVKNREQGDSDSIVILYKVKNQIEKKLQIKSELKPKEFLNTILKDYNALHV